MVDYKSAKNATLPWMSEAVKITEDVSAISAIMERSDNLIALADYLYGQWNVRKLASKTAYRLLKKHLEELKTELEREYLGLTERLEEDEL